MENENQSTNEQSLTEDSPEAIELDPKAEAAVSSAAQVTDAKATIKIEGQTFELDASLAQEDKTLKVVLQPHFASIENANITREVKDGKLSVTIVKRAQHKGYRF